MEVRLADEGVGLSGLSLTHTARLSEHWGQPTGPARRASGGNWASWDFASISRKPDEPKLDEAAFASSPDGRAFITGAAEQWGTSRRRRRNGSCGRAGRRPGAPPRSTPARGTELPDRNPGGRPTDAGGAVSVAIHEPAGSPSAGAGAPADPRRGGGIGTRRDSFRWLNPWRAGRSARFASICRRRKRGRRRPDSPARATACIAAVAHWAAREHAGSLFVGGRSFGGRMASLLLADSAAEARSLVAGAVLLAYPLKTSRQAGSAPGKGGASGAVSAFRCSS